MTTPQDRPQRPESDEPASVEPSPPDAEPDPQSEPQAATGPASADDLDVLLGIPDPPT